MAHSDWTVTLVRQVAVSCREVDTSGALAGIRLVFDEGPPLSAASLNLLPKYFVPNSALNQSQHRLLTSHRLMESGLQSEEEFITKVIQVYRNYRRGPYGVEEALKEAREADTSSLSRIILDESEPAWRAYNAAIKSADLQHKFAGQAELSRSLKYLSNQSTEDQRAFAKQLAYALESDNETSSMRSAKRHRTCFSTYLIRVLMHIGPNELDMPSLSTPNATPNSVDTNYINLEQSNSRETLDIQGLQEGVHVDASLESCKTLFPVETMDSIQRIPNRRLPDTLVADVRMFLQKGYLREQFGCQMEIGIVKEKVPYYAKKLFNVELEAKDGVRYIRYPGCGKIEPDPSIKLRGCLLTEILAVFGFEVERGFANAPIYKREAKEVRDRTDGVSMTISNRNDEGSAINLFLGEWFAFEIRRKLYTLC